ncbi:MAG: hypothetical protein GY856_51570, partial [bacterium]|nr:hypothetical protein [bacterium]
MDQISFIYSDTPSHSIDCVSDPDICLLGHNPTAFTDGPGDSNTGRILNFQNSVTPINSWPLGSAESLWDYGTTRARLLDHGGICDEYFVDYQIPIAALDATASPCAGPAMTTDTPFRVFFATANSL